MCVSSLSNSFLGYQNWVREVSQKIEALNVDG